MATLEELLSGITKAVQDIGIDDTQVLSFINEGQLAIASQVLLPALESSGTVATVTSSSQVAIPSAWNFMRNLYKCEIADCEPIAVLSSMEAMRRAQFSENLDAFSSLVTGDVEFVVIRGSNLFYFPVPTEVKSLHCSFYKWPTALAQSSDEPSSIPLAYQMPLLRAYVCWQAYSLIEQGHEGRKVNTVYYGGEYLRLLGELEIFINHGQSRPRPQLDSGWI